MFIKIGKRYINLDHVTDVQLDKYQHIVNMTNGQRIVLEPADADRLKLYLNSISLDIRGSLGPDELAAED